MKIAALISGGKDSLYAAYKESKKHEIVCIIAIKAKNPASYMFHIPNIEWVKLQAKAMEKPIIFAETEGKKEEELKDLKKALEKAIKDYKIEGIVTGAIKSKYQKTRIDDLCKELGITSLAPLWQIDEEEYLRSLEAKFKVIIAGIAADSLSKEDLGRELSNEFTDKLGSIQISKIGEGGEYESFVLDCPLFKKKIVIKKAEINMESEYSGIYKILEAELQKKSLKNNPQGITKT